MKKAFATIGAVLLVGLGAFMTLLFIISSEEEDKYYDYLDYPY